MDAERLEHFRRILTAVAIFFIAMLGYESWRKHQPGYGFFDLLGAKPEGLAMAGSSKLSENDVPNLAKFSEESMKLVSGPRGGSGGVSPIPIVLIESHL